MHPALATMKCKSATPSHTEACLIATAIGGFVMAGFVVNRMSAWPSDSKKNLVSMGSSDIILRPHFRAILTTPAWARPSVRNTLPLNDRQFM